MKHPRQTLSINENGVVRFTQNEIIGWLFETGKIDLNDIVDRAWRGQFGVEDLRQLAQLRGCSVNDYYELSYAEDPSVEAATLTEQWLREHGIAIP